MVAKTRYLAHRSSNRCNHCGDIAIFRYFLDGGCPPSWICGGTELGHPQTLLGVLHRFAKFGWNRWSRFYTVKVLLFCEFGLKTPIQAPKLFFGLFTPKYVAVTMEPKKAFVVAKYVIWCKDRQNRCNRCRDIAIF